MTSRRRTLPLSSAQQGMWFLERASGAPVFVDPMTLRLEGNLDVAALRWSVNQLVRRHDGLRASFPVVDGGPAQAVAEQLVVRLPVVDLTLLPPRERGAELARILHADTRRPFDLARGPILRVVLVRLGLTEHVFRISVHHLVTDAWSWWAVLFRELETLYRARVQGRASPLPPPLAQYGDFVHWQRSWCGGRGHDTQLAYWRRQLAGAAPLPELSIERPPDAGPPGAGPRTTATLWTTLPQPLFHDLRRLGNREHVTLFILLLAAFIALLHRLTGATDIAVGTRASVRGRVEFERVVGCFVNLLVIRVRVETGQSFRRLLREVRHSALGAYSNRLIPFERLVTALALQRRSRLLPLVNVVFSLQSTPEVVPDLAGLDVRLINHDPQSLYDLDVVFYEEDGRLRALLTYDRSRYAHDGVARLAGQLQELLAACVRDPDVSVGDLLATAEAAAP